MHPAGAAPFFMGGTIMVTLKSRRQALTGLMRNLRLTLFTTILAAGGLLALALQGGFGAHSITRVPPPLPAPPPQAGRIFVVNSAGNSPDVNPGDGRCDTDATTPGEQCTLRAAIMEANASPGDDAIRFEIPASDPACHLILNQCVIPFSTALPDITSNIEFDGPGAKLFQLLPNGVRAFRITTAGTV